MIRIRRNNPIALLTLISLATLLSAQSRTPARAGVVSGHVSFADRPPGNPVIRMGIDPKCADMNRNRQVIQEQALVAADGSVANVFVRLEGSFPDSPVPRDVVVIDQRACVYGPRVVGVRVGQRLQIRNDDSLLHNVHSSSAVGNSFNVGQPTAGMVYEFTPKSAEVMLKLGCDVHRWMVAFVGVMPHPHFAVTDTKGEFRIGKVPSGTYSVKTWHEQFGERTVTVTVKPGATTRVDFSYGAGR